MRNHQGTPVRLRVACLALIAGLASPPAHAAINTMMAGVGNGTGIAVDSARNTVYFVEWVTGALKKITAASTCTTATAPPCSAATVAGGFSHPEDVALDVANNAAYVTTRDDPGTTGALWRVDLATGTKTLITFNLGAPHQMALDVPANSAYVVGYDVGRLWKIDLTTGSKVTTAKGLDHPIGLVMTSNRAYAYVTEEGLLQLTQIELATGMRIDPPVVSGLNSPFFLAWTDPGELALYLAERTPKDIQRIDIPTSSKSAAITGIPDPPFGIAVDWMAALAYVTTGSSVVRIDLGALPLTSPVFLGVGFVPFSDISADGYATTSTPRIYAKDAPFGGTIDIFGNLNRFKSPPYSATHYRVLLDGSPLSVSWSAERYNPSTGRYEAVVVAPAAALPPATTNTLYEIPPEYPTVPERWYPPFLMMRWASSTNGLRNFKIELYKKTGVVFNKVNFSLPDEAANKLALRIDNTAPQVDLLQLYQFTSGSQVPVKTCQIVNTGDPIYRVGFEAYDPNGHLLNYSIWANWGHNRSRGVIPTENYEPGHVSLTRMWYGETNKIVPTTGTPPGWTATCNCAHIFYVGAWKRTINGYWKISYGQAHQAITINNVAAPTDCP